MRRLFKPWGLVAAGVVLMGGAVALLQRPNDRRPEPNSPPSEAAATSRAPAKSVNLRGYSALVLGNDPLVQAELGLSAAQVSELRGLADQFLDSLRPLADDARGLKELQPAAQNDAAARLQRQQQEFMARFDGEALRALTEAQRQRLEEVAFQLRSDEVFHDEHVQQTLQLNREQLAFIARLREDVRIAAATLHKARGRGEVTRGQLRAEIDELRAACVARCEAMLTADQARVLRGLRGDTVPFTADQLCWELRHSGTAVPAAETVSQN